MPFQSKAQRRKFYAMKNRGEMDQKTIDEWESETPKGIPERVEKTAFWIGFHKRADALSSLTGGGGHSGAGKSQFGLGLEFPEKGGPEKAVGPAAPLPMVDKTLMDRERNPRDHAVGEQGPEFQDDSNPHLRY